jgi:hypothetical protein
VLGLGVDQLTGGLNDHLEVAGRLRISDAFHFNLAGELVLKRYCEGVEVALQRANCLREGTNGSVRIVSFEQRNHFTGNFLQLLPCTLIHHNTGQ